MKKLSRCDDGSEGLKFGKSKLEEWFEGSR
jgi:hypothetical protein